MYQDDNREIKVEWLIMWHEKECIFAILDYKCSTKERMKEIEKCNSLVVIFDLNKFIRGNNFTFKIL